MFLKFKNGVQYYCAKSSVLCKATFFIFPVAIIVLSLLPRDRAQEGVGLPSISRLDKPGTCPKPSGGGSACVFDPKKNCLSDDQCCGSEKCCSEGCGKVCKCPISGCDVISQAEGYS
ncbi:unnamed protein product [Allacma fusca]|uniref:WAP domain-containing protein n=1 Tax=Allacma fusca TaxID=39272 RepID=A0A8J2L437_9HEXA|nr:unnamed protein product [Allacma fusca]